MDDAGGFFRSFGEGVFDEGEGGPVEDGHELIEVVFAEAELVDAGGAAAGFGHGEVGEAAAVAGGPVFVAGGGLAGMEEAVGEVGPAFGGDHEIGGFGAEVGDDLAEAFGGIVAAVVSEVGLGVEEGAVDAEVADGGADLVGEVGLPAGGAGVEPGGAVRVGAADCGPVDGVAAHGCPAEAVVGLEVGAGGVFGEAGGAGHGGVAGVHGHDVGAFAVGGFDDGLKALVAAQPGVGDAVAVGAVVAALPTGEEEEDVFAGDALGDPVDGGSHGGVVLEDVAAPVHAVEGDDKADVVDPGGDVRAAVPGEEASVALEEGAAVGKGVVEGGVGAELPGGSGEGVGPMACIPLEDELDAGAAVGLGGGDEAARAGGDVEGGEGPAAGAIGGEGPDGGSALVGGIGEGEGFDGDGLEVADRLEAGEADATGREVVEDELDGADGLFVDGSGGGDEDAIGVFLETEFAGAGDLLLLAGGGEGGGAEDGLLGVQGVGEISGMEGVGVFVGAGGGDLDGEGEAEGFEERVAVVEAPELDAGEAPEVHLEAGAGLGEVEVGVSGGGGVVGGLCLGGVVETEREGGGGDGGGGEKAAAGERGAGWLQGGADLERTAAL